MTVQELASFNVLNDFYLWGGVFLGLVISGFFKTLLNFSSHRFERPRRIRFRNMNGRHERKDNFEYLYLYNGEYYTLEQRDFLVQETMKELRSHPRMSPVMFFMMFLTFSIIVLAAFIFNRNLSFYGF